MNETMTPGALFQAGRLDDAIAAANAAVRAAPADPGPRLLLAEFLLFTGNAQRADTLLDALTTLEPAVAVPVAAFRQLLRAEQARRQVWLEGRVPEFLGPAPAHVMRLLEALVALRGGDAAEAARLAHEAEASRPPSAGSADGKAFDDFRDADDLCAGFLEVLTTTGKYFWIPTDRIIEAEFHPAQRPRDLFWRRVTMSVREGPEGDVFVPALYLASGEAAQPDAVRLGRATEWEGGEGSPVRGLGQRMFLVGEEGRTVMELAHLTFAGAS
ncbi:type VI secretion system accessory protein TagJ [Elioraea rosea]|uniref:type VI secretion system accessory protein TagJ n=1 Tax=Elioraea rosea TaxID=2492390 RepID=UPI0011858D47|nr:type VI secretion system accessory protein TagJ [Elioraea rosea]